MAFNGKQRIQTDNMQANFVVDFMKVNSYLPCN